MVTWPRRYHPSAIARRPNPCETIGVASVISPASVRPPATRAAVLVPIFQLETEWHVVYIERSADSPVHGSQMAFPGGVHRPGTDGTLLDTALREAEEEIGLRREELRLRHALSEVHTMTSNFVIAPFVAQIAADSVFRPDPREVASVWTVPVAELRDPAARKMALCRLHDGTEAMVPTFTVGARVIWGATERITDELLQTLD